MTDQYVQSTFMCTKKTLSACKNEFFQNHPELEYVEVDGDGNCFFRALAAYYEKTGKSIHGVNDPTNFQELRQYIVARFRQQIANNVELRTIYLPGYNERASTENGIEEILNELGTSCVWNVPAFDMMVERAPSYLNINLRLYKINVMDNSNKLAITESLYTPHGEQFNPNRTTISIFLGANHYGLIWPKNSNASQVQNNASMAAALQMMNVNNKPKNNNAAFAKQLQNLNLENKFSNVSSVVSNVSSIGSINEFPIENAMNEYPYKTTTVKEIKELLDEYGVKYHAKNTKEKLYGAFLLAFMTNVNDRTKRNLKNIKYIKKVKSRKAARNARRKTLKK